MNPFRISYLGILLGILLTTGCSHTSYRAAKATLRDTSVPPELAADFIYKHQPDRKAVIKVIETRADYVIKRVNLLVSGEVAGQTNRYVEMEYYDVPGTNRTPVIMVLPMMGGGYPLERHFANYFATRGYSAVIVRRDTRAKGAGVDDLNMLFHDMVVDHRRVVDWIETQPDLDPKRIAIFGVSMGGIKGALLLPLEKRITAAALGLAGGDLPYIMAHSTEPGVAKRREKELKDRNLTLEECERKLREILKFDPLRYASFVDPKKVLLVLARYDTVVPIEKGLELKEKMGNPETIMLPSGHYSAVLSIPYIKSQAFDFFEKRFAEAQPEKLARQGGELKRVQAGRK